MDKVKLTKGDRVIERPKVDYENNIDIWTRRGWKLDEGKPKAPVKDQTIIQEKSLSSEWKEEKPAPKPTKKAK